MCSISGYYKFDKDAKVTETFFHNSFDLMRHRGPDYEKSIQIKDTPSQAGSKNISRAGFFSNSY